MSSVVTTTASHAQAHGGTLNGKGTTPVQVVYPRTGSASKPNKRSSLSTPSPASSRSSLSLTVSTTPRPAVTVSSRPFPSSSSSSLSVSTYSCPSPYPSPTSPSTPSRPRLSTTPRRRGRIHDMASDSYSPYSPTTPASPGLSAADLNPTKAPSYLQYLAAPSSPAPPPSQGYALLEPLSSPVSESRPHTPPTPTPAQTPASPRLVRFDTACVLIPDPPPLASSSSTSVLSSSLSFGRMELRMPWSRSKKEKERGREDKFDILGEEDAFMDNKDEREKEKGVVIRVPIPLFRKRSSSATRSPYPSPPQLSSSPPASSSPPSPLYARKRASSSSPAVPHRELTSCLVHRQHGFAEASASMVRALAMDAVKEEGADGGALADATAPSETGKVPAQVPIPRPQPVRRPSLPTRSSSSSGSGASIPQVLHAHAHARSASLSSTSPASPNPVYTNPAPFLADGVTPNPLYTTAISVPLRACCAACADAMELMDEALRRGEGWEERFTRGARRRRRAGSLQSGPGEFGVHVRDMSVLVPPAPPMHGGGQGHGQGVPAVTVPSVFQGLKAALDADLDDAVRRASTSASVPAEDEDDGNSSLAARALRVDEVDGAKTKRLSVSSSSGAGGGHGLGIQGVTFPAGIAGSMSASSSSVAVAVSSSSSSSMGIGGAGGVDTGKLRLVVPDVMDSPGAESVSSVESYFSLPAAGPSPIAEEHEHAYEHGMAAKQKATREAKDEDDDADLFPLPRRSPAGSARSSANSSPRTSVHLDPNSSLGPHLGGVHASLRLSPGAFDRHQGRGRQRTPSPLGRRADADADEDDEVSLLGAPLSRRASPPPPPTETQAAPTSPVELGKRAVRALPALPQTQAVSSQATSTGLVNPNSVKALPTPPVSPRVPEAQGARRVHVHMKGLRVPGLDSFGREHVAEKDRGKEGDKEAELRQALRAADVLPNITTTPTATASSSSTANGGAAKRERSESRSTRERSHSRDQQQQQQQQQQQTGRRKLSLSAPFIKAGGVLRDAGAEVLRGVSSMGGPGVV